MSDAAIFIGVFGGIFVLRIIAATVFFFFMLPQGDRCLNCDAPTLRVQRAFWHRWLPWFRPSRCMQRRSVALLCEPVFVSRVPACGRVVGGDVRLVRRHVHCG